MSNDWVKNREMIVGHERILERKKFQLDFVTSLAWSHNRSIYNLCMWVHMHVYMCEHVCMSFVFLCMHVCMCGCIYVCVYVFYMYIWICTGLFMFVCMCEYMCLCKCIWMCVCLHVCVSMCMHVCLCVYVCVCMHVYMHVYMHMWNPASTCSTINYSFRISYFPQNSRQCFCQCFQGFHGTYDFINCSGACSRLLERLP